MIMPNDPLTDERWDQDARVATAATEAYTDSVAVGEVDYARRLEDAAGFVQDDIEDALARTREIGSDIGAAARDIVRRAPLASIAIAFGVGCLSSWRRSRR